MQLKDLDLSPARMVKMSLYIFSAIESSGYRSLDEGARVSFVVKNGPKGLQAEQVSLA